MFNKFTNGVVTRYDFKWYGFGKMENVYWKNTAFFGTTFFVNSYVNAPVSFQTLTRFGYFDELPFKKMPRLLFTGPSVDPYHSWSFRLGRAFVGGKTPVWLLVLSLKVRRWWDLREAKRTGEGLCGTCHNGLIVCRMGFPGETFAVCDNCNAVVDYDFDLEAVK